MAKPRQASKDDKPANAAISPVNDFSQWDRWQRAAAKPEYHKAACAVLESFGKVTRMAYLESMYAMEAKYPGRGWQKQADELGKIFADTGKNLREIPRVGGLDLSEIIEEIVKND